MITASDIVITEREIDGVRRLVAEIPTFVYVGPLLDGAEMEVWARQRLQVEVLRKLYGDLARPYAVLSTAIRTFSPHPAFILPPEIQEALKTLQAHLPKPEDG